MFYIKVINMYKFRVYRKFYTFFHIFQNIGTLPYIITYIGEKIKVIL